MPLSAGVGSRVLAGLTDLAICVQRALRKPRLPYVVAGVLIAGLIAFLAWPGGERVRFETPLGEPLKLKLELQLGSYKP